MTDPSHGSNMEYAYHDPRFLEELRNARRDTFLCWYVIYVHEGSSELF